MVIRSVLIVATLALGVVHVPEASAKPFFLLTFHSEPGDWVGRGQDVTLSDAIISVGSFPRDFSLDGLVDYVTFSAISQTINFYLSLAALTPERPNLVPGFYDNVVRAVPGRPGPGLDFGFDNHGSNRVSGNFTILDAVFTGLKVEHFSVEFEQHSNLDAAALFGRFDFDANNPIPPITSAVPEPSGWLLLGSGVAGLALWRRRKEESGIDPIRPSNSRSRSAS